MNDMHEHEHEHYNLTRRELEALGHLAKGLSDREISNEMGIAEGSAGNLISAVYQKLNWLFSDNESTRSRIAKLVRWYLLTYECAQGCLRAFTTYNQEEGTVTVSEPREYEFFTEIRQFITTTHLNVYLNSQPHPSFMLHTVTPAAGSQGSRYLLIWRRPLKPTQPLIRVRI